MGAKHDVQVTTQEKIDVKIAWISIGLAKLHHRIDLQAQDLFCKIPVGKMLQCRTCMFHALLHATLHGSVARFLCNVALCDYLNKVSRHLQSLFYLLDCVKDN